MRKNSRIVTILLMLTLLLGASQVSAAGWPFGSVPLDDVLSNAGSKISSGAVADLSKNELTAMALAITWTEVTGNTQNTPSPMTLSRWDGSYSRLWSFSDKSTSNPYIRSHFNPGIGLWQLDSAGIGKDIGVHQAINTQTSSSIALNEIIRRWKNATGTKKQRRAAAWGAWYGCGSDGSKCETIFNQIYNSSTDTLTVTRDNSVSRTGGMVTKSCKYNWSGSTYFTCYLVDPSQAQGYTGSWYYTLNGNPSTGLSPVPLPFYTYIENSKEHRHWLITKTGYAKNVYATRSLGYNARSDVSWYDNSILTE